jgi:deazaflavin-dependent oxidoreductase (nitroreductase family)
LLLHHTGRKTGAARSTVLEVVDIDRATNTYYVAVGFGRRSDWFRNLRQDPRARIEIGFQKLDVTARALDIDASAARMCSYARRHPMLARALAALMGYEVDGSVADYAELPQLGLQLVALHAN